MIRPFRSPVVERSVGVLTPLIQVFALYVLLHGHHSPGGGFQGGVLLGAGFILGMLAYGSGTVKNYCSPRLAILTACAGVLIYAGIGVVALAAGGSYLDYASLPMPGVAPEWRRYIGILLVEIGVFLGVAGTMVSVFYSLSLLGPDD